LELGKDKDRQNTASVQMSAVVQDTDSTTMRICFAPSDGQKLKIMLIHIAGLDAEK
jgi:hypothetical protein